MKKLHRFLALSAAVLLVLLYVSTLVFALIDSPLTQNLLKVSVAATIILPVLLYGYVLFYRLSKDRHEDDSSEL